MLIYPPNPQSPPSSEIFIGQQLQTIPKEQSFQNFLQNTFQKDHKMHFLLNTPYGFDITLRNPFSSLGETLLMYAIVRRMPPIILWILIGAYGIENIIYPINNKVSLSKHDIDMSYRRTCGGSNSIDNLHSDSDYTESDINAVTFIHVDYYQRNVLDYLLSFQTILYAPDVVAYILSYCNNDVLARFNIPQH